MTPVDKVDRYVYLYAGAGTSSLFATECEKSLKAYLGARSCAVVRLDDTSYLTRDWAKTADAFVVPGGNALEIHASLAKTDAVVRYMNSPKSSFLGFCAGAFVAGNVVYELEKGQTHYWRLYNFVPTSLHYPAYPLPPGEAQASERSARMVHVRDTITGKEYKVL